MALIRILVAALAVAAVTASYGKPGDAWLIRPGNSIGHLRLNENFAGIQVHLKAQPSHDGDAAMGHFWQGWKGPHGGILDIYTVRGEKDLAAHPEQFIRQIRVTSPSFHTRRGIHVGESLGEIESRDKTVTLAKKVGNLQLYDDVKHGIAFEFTTGHCTAIVIHHRGASVLTEYLPFPKYQ